VNLLAQVKTKRNQRGQIFMLLAILIPVLIVFAGLAVDFGLAYITKTTLSKAVDAAALAAMRNLSQGQSKATTIAQNEFNVNYQTIPGRDASPPVLSVTYPTDANNDTLIDVNATATINTYFLRVLSGRSTLSVGAFAEAIRNPLHMSLVLDISYSMTQNGGSGALSPAVQNFIAQFDPQNNNTTDWASMVTFGTSGVVSVPMSQPFKNKINTAVSGINWGVVNWTNSQAGLANGQTQINSVAVAPGQNVVKVAVFFTDGWPNIVRDQLKCTVGSAVLTDVMYCGCDTGDISLGLCGTTPVQFFNPSTCSSSNNTCSTTSCKAITFPDQKTGVTEPLADITWCGGGSLSVSDAMYRAIQVANNMHANNTYVYSIGMGTAITNQPVAQDFLRQVANDPASSTFNPNQPVGEAVFASDSTQLTQVFQTIASKILLRLSR
jgi:Flp pilus assembly protein TadG